MPRCLYCQQDNPPQQAECDNCGMPLPAHADGADDRRQKRFFWFVILLTVFCGAMIIWLPRTLIS